MALSRLRMAGYALCLVQGLLSAVAPRLSLKLNAKLWLSGYENVGELEPKDWYVRATRATGVGMLAAGGVALLLESRAATEDDDDLEVVGLTDDEDAGEATDTDDDEGDDIDADGETDADDGDSTDDT